MSNDKTTLADVQPGGMVRLGDALPPLPPMGYKERGTGMGPHDVYYTPVAYTAEQMRDYARVALSAQPSPGGLGDVREQFEEYRGGDCERDAQGYYVNARTAQDWAMWQAALAASHPVRIYGCCAQPEGELHTAECPNMRHLAARQPVGQEPLWCLHVLGMDDVHPAPSKAHAEKAAAWHNEQFKDQAARLGISIEAKVVPWPHSAESHAAGVAEFIPQWLIPQWQLDALKADASPPVQAVDLGAFKALYLAYVRLLESGRDRIIDLGGTCDPVDVMEANDVDLQAARRVLDSQAVANG
ncbi:TPA: hypothetical protein UOA80_001093 [Stenotrophomonas maltophilia]|uniref:Uncharacterized protein n=1 Tax=Stenotrophomonas maltophilia TaxID=40324 RepID=A0AAI9FVD0_STEMA|nr:hypothetical protein [Stenotrophomonas maltophilia]HEL4101101.1 hypothetical protein [Stenotrophomonas maltophilia]HEL5043519.1 hypothetical protein [Stenotrophomonas maltophilia]